MEVKIFPAVKGRHGIELEGWMPELADWVTDAPRAQPIRKLFRQLEGVLMKLVDRPDEVVLVLPADFAEAVVRRDPDLAGYTTERGSGTTPAKTMRVSDRIEVLLDPRWMLREQPGSSFPAANERAAKPMRYAIQHEAQHVIMKQRGSDLDNYGIEEISGWLRQRWFGCAAVALDEHRAEWNAARLSKAKPLTPADATAVLSQLGTDLAAANNRYQAAPDKVDQLAADVLSTCNVFWKACAYWGAHLRTNDVITDPPLAVTSSELWERYIGDSWSDLANGFAGVPVADLTTDPEVLHAAALHMQGAQQVSLRVMGFRYEGDSSGEAFYMDRWDFPS
ncbi:hypothetical protein [Nocardia wallacei]|uniref:hypothetical protein n=1 Tax=Nocardia wallacei TaxID=480035 RepID=UPI00245530E5|nr:hypothetical protein [Nocardia wallacei]